MRILVYGAGAVGSLLGGKLAYGGDDVMLLGRRPHVVAVLNRGLRIIWPEGEEITVKVDAASQLSEALAGWGRPDLVVLTVKAFDTEKSARELGALLPSSTPVVSFQNGMGNEEVLAKGLGQDRVVAGITTISVSLLEPGTVRQNSSRGGLGLAPVSSEVPEMGEFAVRCREAGFPVRIYQNYRAMKWSKLLLNIMGNAIPALTASNPASVYMDPRLFRLERRAFLEALAVMRCQSIASVNLPGFPVRWLAVAMQHLPDPVLRLLLAGQVKGGRGKKPPSLQLDLQRGRRRTEIGWLNGAIAREGERLGLDVPINAKITELLESVASGEISHGEARRQLLGS